MSDQTLTISIDRASLSHAPLVMLGHGHDPGLGVSDFTEPEFVSEVTYAPESAYIDGSFPLATRRRDSRLTFDVFPYAASTEDIARSWIRELATAIHRLSYPVTVTIGDAEPEVWTCRPGSLSPVGSRNVVNLRNRNPVWSVSLPCHPIPVNP